MAKRKTHGTGGKRTKKRRTNGIRVMPVGRGVLVPASTIPRQQTRKLVYVDKFSRNAGSAAAVSYYFSANSLFDPDRTGIGHQPMGFDQLMDLYDHFTVIGAKLTLKALSSAGDSPEINQIVTIKLRDTDAGAPAQITSAIEQGDCVYGLLGDSKGAAAQLTLVQAVNPVK